MSQKPSYSELEKKVRALELIIHEKNRSASASNCNEKCTGISSVSHTASHKEELKRTEIFKRIIENLLKPTGINKKLKFITDESVKLFNADFARIWITKKGDLCDNGCRHAKATVKDSICKNRERCLHMAASSGRYTGLGGGHRRVPFGCYKIGMIATGVEFNFLTNDVQNDPRIHDREWARQLDLVSFAGYRLLSSDNKAMGVFAIFGKKTITADEDVQLRHMAVTISQVIQTSMVEKALADSEESARALLNATTESAFLIDNDGTFITANQVTADRLGRSADDLIGMISYDMIPPETAMSRRKKVAKVIKSGKPDRFEDERSGVFFDNNIYPLFDSQGTVYRLAVFARDITERKKYEKKLLNAAIEWKSTFDTSNSVIWLLDKDNHIIQSNKMAESVFKTPVESLLGKHCWEIVHETMEPIPECPIFKAKKSLRRESIEIQRGDSWYEVVVDPIKNSDGEFEKAVHIITDISNRKQAELSLKKSELLYKSLFNKNRTIMFLIDPETKYIMDANPSACAYYGYSIDVLTRMKISDINTLSERDLENEILKAKSEKRNYFNFRHRLANGSVNDVEVYSGLIQAGGKSLLCSIIHDISHRKAREAEREELITELKNAIEEIKTLKGIVPICSSCKKIRDDKGYWNQLESYIEKHSNASFSHGICSECSDKMYGNEKWYIDMKKDDQNKDD